jgi:hypothetical protein
MEPTLRSQVANKSPFVDLGQECADNRLALLAQEWEERGRQSYICTTLGGHLNTAINSGYESSFGKFLQEELLDVYKQLPLQIFRDSFLRAIRQHGLYSCYNSVVLLVIQDLQKADDETIDGFMQADDLLYNVRNIRILKDVPIERPDLVSALKRHDMPTLEREIIILCNDIRDPSQETIQQLCLWLQFFDELILEEKKAALVPLIQKAEQLLGNFPLTFVYDEPLSQAEENEILKISKTVEMLNNTSLLNRPFVKEIFAKIFYCMNETGSQKARDCFIDATHTIFLKIYNSLPNREKLGSLEHRYNARLLAIKERTQQLCEQALDNLLESESQYQLVKEQQQKFEEHMKAAKNQLLDTEYLPLEKELLSYLEDRLYTKCSAVFAANPPKQMNEGSQQFAEKLIYIWRHTGMQYDKKTPTKLEPWFTILGKSVYLRGEYVSKAAT